MFGQRKAVDALAATLGGQERAFVRLLELRRQLIYFYERKGFESAEGLVDQAISEVIPRIMRKPVHGESELIAHLMSGVRRCALERDLGDAGKQSVPPLGHLRRSLQTCCPRLYAQVLEPTLADLRLEYSAALADGQPVKARLAFLQGCGALAAAALCQLGYSLLGRIAALWRARSPK